MNKNIDIVFFALSRWDQPISSPALSLAKQFAETNRVFYIEHPYTWKDYFRQRSAPEIKKRKNALFRREDIYTNPTDFPKNLTIVTPPVTIPINFLPESFLYSSIAKINDKRIFETLRSVLRDFDIKDWIFINCFDPFYARDFPADLNPSLKVYQCMDDLSQVPYSAKHGVRLEEDIVRKFDITLCTSKELTRINSRFTNHAYFHPNAADIALFNQVNETRFERPDELKSIDKKIIGFTGSIEYRTDFELVEKLAAHHSDKQLVFVGPLRTDEMNKRGLLKRDNVTLIGPKKITDLPPYLQFMDVVMIPYKKNKLTKSIYPLKINEYLGAGKPVVAVNFSEDISSFADVSYIVDTHDEFIKKIDEAIDSDSDEKRLKRIKRAADNTWEARVRQFWEIVEKREKSL